MYKDSQSGQVATNAIFAKWGNQRRSIPEDALREFFEDRLASVAEAHMPQISQNSMGLPIRIGKRLCAYFNQHGKCWYGEKCIYHHPEEDASKHAPLVAAMHWKQHLEAHPHLKSAPLSVQEKAFNKWKHVPIRFSSDAPGHFFIRNCTFLDMSQILDQTEMEGDSDNGVQYVAPQDCRPYALADFVSYHTRFNINYGKILLNYPNSIVAKYIHAGGKGNDLVEGGAPDWDVLDKVTPMLTVERRPSRDSIVLHMRTGDVCDHGPTVRDLLTSTIHKYCKPLPFFHHIAEIASSKNIAKIVLVTGKLEPYSVSEEYVRLIDNFFRSHGLDTDVKSATHDRFWKEADDHFVFCANASYFATTGGGFGKCIARLVERRGGTVLDPRFKVPSHLSPFPGFVELSCVAGEVVDLQKTVEDQSYQFENMQRAMKVLQEELEQFISFKSTVAARLGTLLQKLEDHAKTGSKKTDVIGLTSEFDDDPRQSNTCTENKGKSKISSTHLENITVGSTYNAEVIELEDPATDFPATYYKDFLFHVFGEQRTLSARTCSSLHETWVKDGSVALKWSAKQGRDKAVYKSLRDKALESGDLKQNEDLEHLEYQLTRHGIIEMHGQKALKNHKMDLCGRFVNWGTCHWGAKCGFAHGSRELRTMPSLECQWCRQWVSIDYGSTNMESNKWYCDECWENWETEENNAGGVDASTANNAGSIPEILELEDPASASHGVCYKDFLIHVFEEHCTCLARTCSILQKTWVKDASVAVKWSAKQGKDKGLYKSLRDKALGNGDLEQNEDLEHLEYKLTRKGMIEMHGQNTLKNYKMDPCSHFIDSGTCRWGANCGFAHGSHELRTMPSLRCQWCRQWVTIDHGRTSKESNTWHCDDCWEIWETDE